MNVEKLELVRDSGNVFRDFGLENADLEQLKVLLAAEIIKALARRLLTRSSEIFIREERSKYPWLLDSRFPLGNINGPLTTQLLRYSRTGMVLAFSARKQ